MSWVTGSGFGSYLLSLIAGESFQKNMLGLLQFIGRKILENIDSNPQAIKLMAQNLTDNPKAALGAVVVNTDAESLVDEHVVDAAKGIT